MEPIFFVVLAYGVTALVLAALCIASVVRARAVDRQLQLGDGK